MKKKLFPYSSQLKGIVGFKVQAKERKGMFRRKRKMKGERLNIRFCIKMRDSRHVVRSKMGGGGEERLSVYSCRF